MSLEATDNGFHIHFILPRQSCLLIGQSFVSRQPKADIDDSKIKSIPFQLNIIHI